MRVPLLGERLVAFRDSDGQVGLLDEACPHRGASLALGRNEEGGLRCIYHGWQFERTGRCLDTPTEPVGSTFAQRVRAVAYPVQEAAGIVWAYLGPPDLMQRETPARLSDARAEGMKGEIVWQGSGWQVAGGRWRSPPEPKGIGLGNSAGPGRLKRRGSL